MNPIFENIKQNEIPIRQYKGKSPMFFRKFQMMAGVFTADYAYCRSIVPRAIPHILQFAPGRALVAIHCMQYLETDVGPYNEISISIGINPSNSLSIAAILKAMLTHSYHAYILHLPVTTEVAYFGGIDYFNFPKFIADIDFIEDEDSLICHLRNKNTQELIVSFTGKKISTKENKFPLSLNSYPIMNEKLMHSKIIVNRKKYGEKLFSSFANIEYGNGEIATQLRDMKLGMQLQYMYIPECESVLYLPTIFNSNKK